MVWTRLVAWSQGTKRTSKWEVKGKECELSMEQELSSNPKAQNALSKEPVNLSQTEALKPLPLGMLVWSFLTNGWSLPSTVLQGSSGYRCSCISCSGDPEDTSGQEMALNAEQR